MISESILVKVILRINMHISIWLNLPRLAIWGPSLTTHYFFDERLVGLDEKREKISKHAELLIKELNRFQMSLLCHRREWLCRWQMTLSKFVLDSVFDFQRGGGKFDNHVN